MIDTVALRVATWVRSVVGDVWSRWTRQDRPGPGSGVSLYLLEGWTTSAARWTWPALRCGSTSSTW
jgi:hypothetical protein